MKLTRNIPHIKHTKENEKSINIIFEDRYKDRYNHTMKYVTHVDRLTDLYIESQVRKCLVSIEMDVLVTILQEVARVKCLKF